MTEQIAETSVHVAEILHQIDVRTLGVVAISILGAAWGKVRWSKRDSKSQVGRFAHYQDPENVRYLLDQMTFPDYQEPNYSDDPDPQ